jgi:hypothetical protein
MIINSYNKLHSRLKENKDEYLLNIEYKSSLLFSKICFLDVSGSSKEIEPSHILDSISPPRRLRISRLPQPPFHTHPLSRYFWKSTDSLEASLFPLIRDFREPASLRLACTQRVLKHADACLPLKGLLKQDAKGFVFIELPYRYFEELLPFFGPGLEKPCTLGTHGPLGAHIPVILAREWTQCLGLGSIGELGEEFTFELTGAYSQKVDDWPSVDKVWFLTLKCPQATLLRERFLLPAKIRGYDFHLTIGVQKSTSQASSPHKLYRVNVSCYAA